jgi:hypothetical protein
MVYSHLLCPLSHHPPAFEFNALTLFQYSIIHHRFGGDGWYVYTILPHSLAESKPLTEHLLHIGYLGR